MGEYVLNISVEDMGIVLKSLFYMSLRYDGEDPTFVSRATNLRARLLARIEYTQSVVDI